MELTMRWSGWLIQLSWAISLIKVWQLLQKLFERHTLKKRLVCLFGVARVGPFQWLNTLSWTSLSLVLLISKQADFAIVGVYLHMFTLDFLNQVTNGLEKDSIVHLAEKKIPSIHGQTMGYKLEQFIFDAFPYASSTALFEVLREEEFAPMKNANGSNFDTPDSTRLLVLRLHARWVVAAGGFLTQSVLLCNWCGSFTSLLIRW